MSVEQQPETEDGTGNGSGPEVTSATEEEPKAEVVVTELPKMKTNACLPENMSRNAVVQPLLTGGYNFLAIFGHFLAILDSYRPFLGHFGANMTNSLFWPH